MKRFSFKLDVLLDLRKKKEDEIKLRLGAQNARIVTAQQEFTRIHDELKMLQTSEKEKRPDSTNVVLLRYSISYRHKLKGDLLAAGRKVDELKAGAYKIQKELIEATKKRRAIELVRDHRYREWKKENQEKELKFIDDISQQLYIRKLYENDQDKHTM